MTSRVSELIHCAELRAAADTHAVVGNVADAPATASLLAGVMLAHGLRAVASGADPAALATGIDRAVRIAIDVVHRLVRPTLGNDIVPGAGFVFVRALAVLEIEEPHFFEDERAGVEIVCHALVAPVFALARRVGLPPDEVLEHMRDGHGAVGVDPLTGAFVDLVAAGVTTQGAPLRVALRAAAAAVTAALLDTSAVSAA